MADLTAMLQAAAGQAGEDTDPFFNQTTLLLHGDGTNGAQNNTFLDSSTNNFTITRNGNTTQGTFSPFSLADGEFSNYFDGTSNGSLRADSSTDTNLSGDFTIQAWVYPTANGQSSNSEIISRGATTTLNGWHFGLFASTTQPFFGVNYAGAGSTVFTQSSTNIPLNQWTHLAVTRSGNTVVIYINGVADTTNAGFTGTPTVSGTEYVYVGRASYDTSNRQFTGYVSNASIIKGTAAITFNTTSPLATGTSGQSLLTCYLNRFVDANTATTAKALTVGSGASVQPFSPFAPSAAYDSSVNGGSGYFDGSGDYLTGPSASGGDFSTGDFTVSFWFYKTASGFSGSVAYADSGGWNGWQVNLDNPGTVTWQFLTASAGAATITGGSYRLNEWNYVTVTRSSGTITLYVNGTSAGTTTDAGSYGVAGSTVRIGTDRVTNYVTGYIAGVKLVKQADTPSATNPTAPPTATANTSFLANFTNAGIFDNTGKNNLETVGNAQIDTSVKKYGTGSMEFDGTGDYLSAVTNPNVSLGSGNFTIEGWFYITADNTFNTLLSKYSGTASTSAFEIDIRTSLGALRSQWYYGSSSTTQTISFAFSTGTWYHIAFVRSSGTLKTYIDGSEEGSTSLSVTINDGTTNLQIGGNSVDARYLNGFIDDLRITKGVARYTAAFTPPTAAFPDL